MTLDPYGLRYHPYIDPAVLTPTHQGKTRETYQALTPGNIVQVVSDRVSTHNIVHWSPIPCKGEVLTMLTLFWFNNMGWHYPHHLVASGRGVYKHVPDVVRDKYPDLHYRALVVRELDMLPIEFIFRRYLTGSLLKAYNAGKDPYGIELPPGLTQMSRFEDRAVFTPTDKSETDDPLSEVEVLTTYPNESMFANGAFATAEKHLAKSGIALVDTKLEIGRAQDGSPVLADEVFTPDSSRYVYVKDVVEGQEPPWLDKQYVRNEAERIWDGGKKRPLDFSDEVVQRTTATYEQLLVDITGATRHEWREAMDATGSL